MARIYPFRGMFFNPGKVGSLDAVVAQPYDKIDETLRDQYLARHPRHIVRISKGKDEPGDTESGNKYTRAGALIDAWLNDGTIVRDTVPAIYASYQEFKDPQGKIRVRRGFAALGRLEDFGKGGVHAHEKTLLAPKQDRHKLMTATRGLTEGHIFMLYSDAQGVVNRLLDECTRGTPDFTAKDDFGETHKVWRITDAAKIAAIQAAMEKFDLFIADGHHRYEVALQYRDDMRKLGRTCEGNESFENRLMTFFNMDDPGMVIFPTHRVVHSLKEFDAKAFLAGLRSHFDLREFPFTTADEARVRGEWLGALHDRGQRDQAFGLTLSGAGAYWLLVLKDPAQLDQQITLAQSAAWKRLDVTVLTELILNQRLGITAEKLAQETNVHYVRYAEEAVRAVREGKANLAVLLNPTRLAEVQQIAGQGERMPQKSTDFYPKLLSGFIMNRVNFTPSSQGEKPMHRKLFIPGPVEVHPDLLQAMATPMIGHRDPEYSVLHKRVKTKLQKMLCTKRPVFFSTSSAWGVMEGAVRNLVAKRALNLMCGAFSDHWHEVTKDCGKEADPLQVEWGKAIKPDMVDRALSSGKYDVVTLIHNETSTGVMNPLAEITAVVKKYPEVLLVVDAVSAMAGVPIDFDALGLDVLLAGVQKAFGLPPGMAVFTVSERAMQRAAKVPGRGYYFDFLTFQKFDEKDQTPSTPSISHLFALDKVMERIENEGFANRCARHQRMAEICRAWVKERGFEMFPEPGYASVTLSTVRNTRKIDMKKLNEGLAKRGYVISDGYGKLKGETFRIAHMADTTEDELRTVLRHIDEVAGLVNS